MEAEQRIQALEQEVQILKTQIQSILLDIQTHLLTNAYPALRGHHTASSSPEERLQQLEKLYQKKLITKDEYEKKRAQILSEI